MTIVIPVKIHNLSGGNDLKLLRILLSSLDLFLPLKDIAEIVIVVRDDEYQEVESSLRTAGFSQEMQSKLSVTNESELFTEREYDALSGLNGWHVQMMIKLAIAHRVATEAFLILDCDCFCCRPTSLHDLKPGKFAINYYPRISDCPADQQKWFESSAFLLDYQCDPDHPGIAVTPQILIKAVCEKVTQRISDSNSLNWVSVLAKAINSSERSHWTEYSLYSTYLSHNGGLGLYYQTEPWQAHRLVSEWGAWNGPAAKTSSQDQQVRFSLLADLLLKGDLYTGAPFVVIQSNNGFDTEDTIDLLREYLDYQASETTSTLN